MLGKPTALVLACLALTTPAAAEDLTPAATSAELERTFDAALNAGPSGDGLSPGCAVRVSRGGTVLLSKAYGLADIERGVPYGVETVSEAGSVAKQFMATQILMLAEAGKLSLDDDIRKYLPEMPEYVRPVRIYNLLHHTSGLREYTTLAALRGYPRFFRTVYDNDAVFALIAAQRGLNFPPGDRFQYTNSNYVLLTRIVERVSGMPAAEYGQRYIFSPLGMRSTRWRDDARTLVPGRALAYRRKGTGYELFMPTENTYGHGALLTTVGDLERWNDALMSGGLPPFVTRHLLEQARVNDGSTRPYGAGIALLSRAGQKTYRHGGVTAGYTAELWALPEKHVSVAVLCNASLADIGDLAGRAAELAAGLSPSEAIRISLPKVTPPKTWDFYGTAEGELLAIGRSDSGLVLNLFTQGGPIALAGKEPEFHAETGIGRTMLSIGPAGSVLLRIEGREVLHFHKLPRAARSEPMMGRYTSRELGASFVLSRDKSGLRLALDDPLAPDPIAFRLEWLNGSSFRARVESRSGALRDDMVVTFRHSDDARCSFTMSSVAGLQAVDMLIFTGNRDCRRHSL